MENDPLKRLLAEATLHNSALKDLLLKIWSGPPAIAL